MYEKCNTAMIDHLKKHGIFSARTLSREAKVATQDVTVSRQQR
jgi:hypothetical protein